MINKHEEIFAHFIDHLRVVTILGSQRSGPVLEKLYLCFAQRIGIGYLELEVLTVQ